MSTEDPDSEETAPREPGESPGEAEAQRAADALKAQIAAVRARVRSARETLAEHARRVREGRSFKR